MNAYLLWAACLLLFQTASPPRARPEFHWNWHRIQSPVLPLKEAKIPTSARLALAKAIEAQIGPPDPRNPDLATEEQAKQAALNADIELISLNQDQKEPLEVVAHAARGSYFCGATGNCSLWFFRKTSQGYALLLSAIGQGFTVQKTATNGFNDLVVNMHSSATDQWLKVYRYARGRYWRVACYDADWAPLENGVIHQLKEPQITPTTCN